MVSPDGYEYRDPTSLSKWARWLICAYLVISSIAMISETIQHNVLTSLRDGVYETEEAALAAATASDWNQMVVGLFQLVIAVATGIVTLRWIHRANWNARALGAARLDFTPGWSVGWYFVPLMNLWKPYQAMKQIWQASAQPRDWQVQPIPAVLGWWWFLWVISTLLGNASFRAGMRGEELDQLITASSITLASDVVSIPLCVVFLIVTTRISAMQARHVAAWAPPATVAVPVAGA
jgi:hypothetical protein